MARGSPCSGSPPRREGRVRQPLAELDRGSVSGVGHDGRFGGSLGAEEINLLEGELPLGPEADLPWHPRRCAARAISGPLLGEIETVGRRDAHGLVDKADRHRHLAVVLLADVPA